MEHTTTAYETVHTWTTSGGLVFMVIMFLGILFYALRPGNKKIFDHAASLALNEDIDTPDEKTESAR
ncbi:MAG: CcoQ/FixQ family Cbb3-type cytochrome c oxidase assembly chaperone [Rhizobiales bacterium]|nr:CcoQ/FixQ family Cbb3-type cytochrome c oxidase assembly chaperone [Hyphomicrobiales bacterium]